MDGRKNNGGHKTAGRKAKAEEQELIERLSPLEDKALKALEDGIKAGSNWAVKLFFEYRYGKPSQDISLNAQPKGSKNIEDWLDKTIIAYFPLLFGGYSKNTARSIANENLTKPNI